MRFKSILCLGLLTAAVSSGAPVAVDMAHSDIEVTVKATVGTFVAQLQDFDVSATVTSQTGQVTAGFFRFNFGSLKTGNAVRDRDMNEWLQTDRFPGGVFTLTALEPAGEGKAIARGRLRFHGVEKFITFPISIETNKQIIAMDGDVTIDTRDYGLPIIRTFLVLTVDPIVHVHFHVRGTLAGS